MYYHQDAGIEEYLRPSELIGFGFCIYCVRFMRLFISYYSDEFELVKLIY